MNSKYTKIVAKVAAAATVLAMFSTVAPAFASGTATSSSDTLTREKISVASVGHVVLMTLPSAQTGTLTLTYPSFSAFAFTSAVCSTSGTAVDNGTATNVVNLTLTACLGNLTINFTGTNPGTAGSYAVAFGGTATLTGSYAVPIVNEDQISVTATVDPSITFDVGTTTTTCDGTFVSSTYTLPLGTLTSGSVTRSDTGGIRHICTLVSTNATHGVAVTVKNLNGASGLKSASVPADTIPSLSATMAAGTANYGLCNSNTIHGDTSSTPASNPPVNGAFSTAASCGGATPVNVAFDGTSQSLWTTVGVVNKGYWQSLLSSTVSGTTAAHTDYADTLTFIATGTF